MTHRVEAQVSLPNIRHNYNYIKSLAGGECRVLSVVKADAYGHGAVEVCKTLIGEGADFFAVACVEEALCLRENGIGGDILILGITDEKYSGIIRDNDIIQTVDSFAYASKISENGKIRAHIKIDTGMSRLGVYCHGDGDIETVAAELEKIYKLPNISAEGIFTHFAQADEPETGFTEKQYAVFEKLLEKLADMNINVGLRHCCNSAGLLNFPRMRMDAVRSGLILYGLLPSPAIKDDNFMPAMFLKSRISAIKDLKKGDRVSYGCAYTAQKDIRAAIISIGYADGFSRALNEKAVVRINGSEARIIGKICMDLCVADVTGIDCLPGGEVVIFENSTDIDRIAAAMNTIGYEVICSIKNRVKKIYLDIL